MEIWKSGTPGQALDFRLTDITAFPGRPLATTIEFYFPITTPFACPSAPLKPEEPVRPSFRHGILWRGQSAGFPLRLGGPSFEPQMDTDDHGLFPGEVIRGNPRESAASAPCRLRGEGWSEGLGRPPPQGSGVDGGSVDPGRWSSIKMGGLSARDSVNGPTTVVSGAPPPS